MFSTKYWMVHVEGSHGPNVKYHSKDTAMQRCQALARETRKRVYLLEAVLCIEAEVPVQPVTFHTSVPVAAPSAQVTQFSIEGYGFRPGGPDKVYDTGPDDYLNHE